MKIIRKIPVVSQIAGYRELKREIKAYLTEAVLNRNDPKEHNKFLRYASTKIHEIESKYPMYIHKTSVLRDMVELERGNLEGKI